MEITRSESRIRFLKTHVECCLIMGSFNCAINQLLTLKFCTHLKMCFYTAANIYVYPQHGIQNQVFFCQALLCAAKETRTYSLSPQVCEMVIHICMARFSSISEQSVFDQAVYSEFVIPQTMSESLLVVCQLEWDKMCQGACRQSNNTEKHVPAFKSMTCLFS